MRPILIILFAMVAIAAAIQFMPVADAEPEVRRLTPEEVVESEARFMHYEAAQPDSIEKARSQLRNATASVLNIILLDNTEPMQLEKVHEITYSMENAVDVLRAKEPKSRTAEIDALDEVIQALHYASENNNAEDSRAWAMKLQTAWSGYTASNVAENVKKFGK